MAHTKVTKNGTQNTGTANTFSYSGSFDVFKASEVEVELDNIALTFTTSTINESASPREYTVDYGNKTVHIGGANLTSNDNVTIQPVTDMGDPTPRATYAPGSSVTSEDLNNNQLQLMRKAMEYNEQKLSSRGGTMTGNLHLGQNVDLSFEGDNDNTYETTLTVADPTADRTITLPNVTGTVVTTGDTGTVATGMIATDAVTTAKIVNDAITTNKIVNNAVTTAKLADDSVGTQQIAAQSIGTTEIAPNAVTTAKITDGNITTAKIAADAINGTKIADDAIGNEHLSNPCVQTENITDDAITTAKIADGAVNDDRLASSSVSTAKIANVAVTDDKLASNAVITSKITDANVTTVKIADSNITLAKLASDLKQTSISDSDTQLPTSGAVVDYVAAQLQPFGGFEAVATEVAFPNTQPVSGVAISISDAGGVVINGSGVSTTGRTIGGSTVTINGFPSSLYNETLVSGVGLIVTSTGSSQTYNYHKILGKEEDIKQLSDDINDFNARYRVGSSNPTSALDSGDLFFNTGSGKLLVYNGTQSAWEEAQSIGQYFINTLSSYSGTGGNSASFDNNAYRFVLSNPGAVAEQHIVSINGVIQKPNSGTGQPSEGFAIDGSSIIFSSAPATGADFFIITIGSTVNIGTPSDGTVTASKLTSGAVETAKIADDAVINSKIANGAVDSEHLATGIINNNNLFDGAVVNTAQIVNNAVTTNEIANNAVTQAKIAADAVQGTIIASNAITTAKIAADAVTQAQIADDAVGTDQIAAGSITTNRLADSAVSESKLNVSNSPTNGYLLSAQSGNTGGLTWVQSPSSDLVDDTTPQLGGDLDTNGRNINFGHASFNTDDTLRFGANGNDLYINHGGNANISANTGDLYLRNTGDFSSTRKVYIMGKVDEQSVTCNSDGSVELYHDNSKKIETTSYGTKVTGYQSASSYVGFHVMGGLSDHGFGTNHGSGITNFDVDYYSPIPMFGTKTIDHGSSYLSFPSYAGGNYVKFTAPVAGLYQLELIASVESHHGGDWFQMGWEINTTTNNNSSNFANNSRGVLSVNERAGDDTETGCHFSTTIWMDTNDYAVLYQQSSAAVRWRGNQYYVRGHLI